MRRLALKLPTALQIHSSYAILFHEGGVSEFAHAEIHPDYRSLMVLSKRPSRRIWALVDTNANLPEPASIFKHASPFFVVDAVPHRSDRLRWINKIGHDYFYMKPWSDLEVLQAYVDLVSGNSRHSHSPVARSSIRPTQNHSSGTCTRNLARLPGTWFDMPVHRAPTKVYSLEKLRVGKITVSSIMSLS